MRNNMSSKVAGQGFSRGASERQGAAMRDRRSSPAHAWMPPEGGPESTCPLYSREGLRKYLNHEERRRLLATLSSFTTEQRLFLLTLFWTGARISEVLGVRGCDVQAADGRLVLRTLKRRRTVFREVPIPPTLASSLAETYPALRDTITATSARRLWPWHRSTAWRLVHHAMMLAHIAGRQASPRGLRHGFAIATLRAGVPLTLLQRWLGHARLSTTALYVGFAGPDETELARKVWRQAA